MASAHSLIFQVTMTQNVGKLYKAVIDDVVNSVREAFADEGIDEQVLLELKATWEKRLSESKAVSDSYGHQVQTLAQAAGGSKQQPNVAGGDTSASLSTPLVLPGRSGKQPPQQTPTNNGTPSASSSIPNFPPPPTVPSIPPPSGPSSQLTSISYPPGMRPSNSQRQFNIGQVDGPHDTSDEDDDDDDAKDRDDDDRDDDRDDDDGKDDDVDNESPGEDEEPLNSEDDVSDEEPNELFETDNVVVCQYDKITRSRNKWKFHLKDGIMNLQGKDYVFQKAVGDAEW